MRKIVSAPCSVEDSQWKPRFSGPSSTITVLSNLVNRLRAAEYEHDLEPEFQFKPEFAAVGPIVSPNTCFPCSREKVFESSELRMRI